MSTRSAWGPRCVALLVLLTVLLVSSGLSGLPSAAAQATTPPPATVPPGAGRAGQSPTVLGDINNDGIVDTRDYGVWRQNFGQTGTATNCIPVGAICRANVSTFVGTTTGTISLADCANPADPVNCARLASVANGFTVTGRFGPVSGNFGVNLTIAVVDATTGAAAGTRTVNCPGSTAACSNTLVSGNVRPQLGGSVTLSTQPVGAPDSTGLHELAGAAPDRDPT